MDTDNTARLLSTYLELKNTAGQLIQQNQNHEPLAKGRVDAWVSKAERYLSELGSPMDYLAKEDERKYSQIVEYRDLLLRLPYWTEKAPEDGNKKTVEKQSIVDSILEDRGKTYGDSNNSGMFFHEGVRLIIEITNRSGIERPTAFNGHLFMAMFKLIRLTHNPYHRDSYDDLRGYLKLAMKALELVEGGESKNGKEEKEGS